MAIIENVGDIESLEYADFDKSLRLCALQNLDSFIETLRKSVSLKGILSI